jgi:MSHA biogenesis protein MshE
MTGYRGRVAIYELLELDRQQAEAIRRNDLVQFAHVTAGRRDYKPLARSAIELVALGVTTLFEAMAAVSGINDDTEGAEAPGAEPGDAQAEADTPIGPERVLALLS